MIQIYKDRYGNIHEHCLGDAAFEDCNDIIEIKMSDKVTRIGNGAFGGCTALEK